MDITEKVQEWLEKARERFFALDLRELDESLTPEERVEWDNIYASFRSGSLMRGRIIGLEHMPRPEAASRSRSRGQRWDGHALYDRPALPCQDFDPGAFFLVAG